MKHLFVGLALVSLALAPPAVAQVGRTNVRQAGAPCVVSVPTLDGDRALATCTVPQRADGTVMDPAQIASANLATGQSTVATTSTLVAAQRTNRKKITVTLMAANDCYFGNAGVTSATGFRVKGVDGAALTIDTTAAIYAACSAATGVAYLEQF